MKFKQIKLKLKKHEYVFVLLIGISLIYWVYFKYEKGTRGLSWPTTEGIIIKA